MSEEKAGLCANPDCGQVLDDGGVPLLDRQTNQVVDVCETCADQLLTDAGHGRYEQLFTYQEPDAGPVEPTVPYQRRE